MSLGIVRRIIRWKKLILDQIFANSEISGGARGSRGHKESKIQKSMRIFKYGFKYLRALKML